MFGRPPLPSYPPTPLPVPVIVHTPVTDCTSPTVPQTRSIPCAGSSTLINASDQPFARILLVTPTFRTSCRFMVRTAIPAAVGVPPVQFRTKLLMSSASPSARTEATPAVTVHWVGSAYTTPDPVIPA